jgi:tRNA nucleotidyltransferase/poly(A) polymerase
LTSKVIDDIKKRIIRVTDPANAEIIFSQDPLRILRAVRQKLQLGFDIDELTFDAMKKNVSRIHIIAPERIREEINKILTAGNPSASFYLMREIGLLAEIFPELDRLYGIKQPSKYHDFDVFVHTFKVLDRTPSDLVLRMSALLHDSGKYETFRAEDGKISFRGHEENSSVIAEQILKRLHYPKEFSRKVVNIIRNHMHPKHYSPEWKDSAVRRFANTCGEEQDYVLELAKYDYGKEKPDDKIFEFSQRINCLKKRNLLYPKKELISGRELMEYFAMTQGEWIKKAKERLCEAQLDNPELTKEEAFILVKEMLNKSGK